MAFKTKSTAERLIHVYEGATIFYHRLLYDTQGTLIQLCSERGETNWRKLRKFATQDAADGWDEHVQDADGQSIAVPTQAISADFSRYLAQWLDQDPLQKQVAEALHWDDRRLSIAMIVSTFPTDLLIQLGELAFADDPETAKKNLPLIFGGNFSLPIVAPASSSPVGTVDATAAPTDSASLATEAG